MRVKLQDIEQFTTIPGAAERFGRSESSIRWHIDAGRIPVGVVGNGISIVRIDDVERVLKTHARPGRPRRQSGDLCAA